MFICRFSLVLFGLLSIGPILLAQSTDTLEYSFLSDLQSPQTSEWLRLKQEKLSDQFKKSDFNAFNRRLQFNYKPRTIKSSVYTVTLKTFSDSPPVILSEKTALNEISQVVLKLSDLRRNKNDFPFVENIWISDPNSLLVVAVSHSGSDWLEFMLFNLETREHLYTLTGIIRPWLLFGDNGFYYEKYDELEDEINESRKNQKIAFHALETGQSRDRIIFQNPDTSSIRIFNFNKPNSSDYLFIFHSYRSGQSWNDAITAIDLNNPTNQRNILTYKSPNTIDFDFIMENDGGVYFRTNLNSPNYEVVRFSLNELNNMETIIPSYRQVLIEAIYLGNEMFGLKYLDRGKYAINITDFKSNSLAYFPVPDGSGVNIYRGNDPRYAYMAVTNFCIPSQTYRIDLKNKMTVEFSSGQNLESYEDFQTELTEYTNSAGQKIPVYLVYERRKMKKNGNNPALIRAYAGYGQIIEPEFSWENYYIVRNGGILVVPAIRGGGELGSNWANSGRGRNKENAVSDVISVAEFLINNNYSTNEKIILEGGSHGGFLVTAAALRRPDLFQGVISMSGIYDLTSFVNQSVGNALINRIEFGDPNDPETKQIRENISPISNLKDDKKYPAFLLITGSNDTRVPPSQTYRFMAQLENKSTNQNNFLFITNGGHSIASYPDEILELMSLKLKFIYLITGEKLWL